MRPLADLHTHLEGSLPFELALELAKSAPDHPWCDLDPKERKTRFDSFEDFLDSIRAMCSLLCSEEALEETARQLSLMFGHDGLRHAEVYVSPHIYERWELSPARSMAAVIRGFERAESEGGTPCTVLLDSVRQWGPDAAHRVLDAWEEHRWERVRGFGLGGEESVPLRAFLPVYERARSLGLHTVAHAGETGPPADVGIAVEELGVERIAHGIHAIEDHSIITLLRERDIPLDLAITSNYATRAVEGAHPLRQLLDGGVRVTIGTDDPALFDTTPRRELARAVEAAALSEEEIQQILFNAVRYAFVDDARKRELLEDAK